MLSRRTHLQLLLAFSLACGALPPAQAVSCSLLSYALDDAKAALQGVEDGRDLLVAQARAWRARGALTELAQAAHGCVCGPAGAAFARAALDAQTASRAADLDQFSGALALSVGAFNAGQAALQSCGRLPR